MRSHLSVLSKGYGRSGDRGVRQQHEGPVRPGDVRDHPHVSAGRRQGQRGQDELRAVAHEHPEQHDRLPRIQARRRRDRDDGTYRRRRAGFARPFQIRPRHRDRTGVGIEGGDVRTPDRPRCRRTPPGRIGAHVRQEDADIDEGGGIGHRRSQLERTGSRCGRAGDTGAERREGFVAAVHHSIESGAHEHQRSDQSGDDPGRQGREYGEGEGEEVQAGAGGGREEDRAERGHCQVSAGGEEAGGANRPHQAEDPREGVRPPEDAF
mmetsp:Transcript_63093/g.186414  ORF Transcript_63093/g.186414 Transcript_63093/m.186414 type:complete len:265 (+) Transcript_63093:1107-1901(+)